MEARHQGAGKENIREHIRQSAQLSIHPGAATDQSSSAATEEIEIDRSDACRNGQKIFYS
jgi:hypothetical protein